MSQMIESMESRRLLSASVAVITGDLEALAADARAAKIELPAALATSKADLKALKVDVATAVKQLTKTQKVADKKVLNTLVKAESKDLAKYKSKAAAIFSSVDRSGKTLVAELKSLVKHPGNKAIEKKIVASLGKLENAFSSPTVATLELLVSTAIGDIDTNLNALATAIPSTQADVTTAESHFATEQTELDTGLTTTATDITKLVGDVL